MKHIHLSMRDLTQIIVAESDRGKNTHEIVAYLRQRGWPESSARAFVSNILSTGHSHRVDYPDQPKAESEDPTTAQPSTPSLTWLSIGLGVFFLLFVLLSGNAVVP